MGKLIEEINQQLKDNPDCLETKEVLKIYNTLLSIDGTVMSSAWSVLTNVKFTGKYPNSKKFIFPSKVYLALKNSLTTD